MSLPESLTVIVPTRNRASYVATSVPSILASAEEASRRLGVRTRVLVVDDAPDNDETEQVARRFGVDYVAVAEHDGRADPGAAIVLGVRHVDTQIQTIFGDDDFMLPAHIALAFAKLAEGFDVVSSSFKLTDEALIDYKTVELEPTGIGDLIAGHTMVNDGSFVAHDLVKDLDWDVSLEAQMLVPIWAELMLQGRRFGVVEEPTWLYRRHSANISLSALTPRDLELRARTRQLITDRTQEVLGYVPASPRAASLARKEAQREWAKATVVRRGRNKAARMILAGSRRVALKVTPNLGDDS